MLRSIDWHSVPSKTLRASAKVYSKSSPRYQNDCGHMVACRPTGVYCPSTLHSTYELKLLLAQLQWNILQLHRLIVICSFEKRINVCLKSCYISLCEFHASWNSTPVVLSKVRSQLSIRFDAANNGPATQGRCLYWYIHAHVSIHIYRYLGSSHVGPSGLVQVIYT